MQRQIEREEPDSANFAVQEPVASPAQQTPTEREIELVVRSAEAQLDELEGKSQQFTKQAFDELKRQVRSFVGDLITESGRDARRQNVDVVSRSHVQKAGASLVTGSGKKLAKIAGAVGGIILGLGSGLLINMVSSGAFTFQLTLISIALCFVGLSMVAYQLAKD